MRLVIICEGDTEEKVLKKFLEPFLTKFQENVDILNTKGVGKLKNQFRKLAELELEEPETIVFCLFDLYEAPFNYSKEVHEAANPVYEKYNASKSMMESIIDKRFAGRFFAFPVVHELETWILADIVSTKSYFRTSSLSPYTSPETVEQPAAELKTLLRRHQKRDYDKRRDGSNLFDLIDAQRVYDDNCPHFVAFIDQLLVVQGIDKEVEKVIPPLPMKIQLEMELQQVREKLGSVTTDEELNHLIDEETEIKKQIAELD